MARLLPGATVHCFKKIREEEGYENSVYSYYCPKLIKILIEGQKLIDYKKWSIESGKIDSQTP